MSVDEGSYCFNRNLGFRKLLKKATTPDRTATIPATDAIISEISANEVITGGSSRVRREASPIAMVFGEDPNVEMQHCATSDLASSNNCESIASNQEPEEKEIS